MRYFARAASRDPSKTTTRVGTPRSSARSAPDGDALWHSDAFIEQPGAHLVVALEPQPGREEALTDEPDLVLDLVLLPARCRRARLLHEGVCVPKTQIRTY